MPFSRMGQATGGEGEEEGGDEHRLMRLVHPWRTDQGLWSACLAMHEQGTGVLEAGGGVSVK